MVVVETLLLPRSDNFVIDEEKSWEARRSKTFIPYQKLAYASRASFVEEEESKAGRSKTFIPSQKLTTCL